MANIDSELSAIAVREKSLDDSLVALQEKYPDVFQQIQKIEDAQAEVKKLKEAIKDKLVAERDFDLHEVGDLSVKVSGVAKVKVVNIDEVPDDFKEEKLVANEKKAQDYLKLMGECPKGFEDATYYRLNWKVKSNEK